MSRASALARGLAQGAEAMALNLSDSESKQLLTYLALITAFNRKHNLTAVRDPVEMVPRHLLDSLSILPWLPPGRMLDLGSGAGLPGIPLAVVQPQRELVLLDASFKRVVFLQQVIRELALPRVTALHHRVETARLDPFDAIVTRGFASLDKTVQTSGHLLSENGCWVAMKGRYPASELQAVAAMPGLVELQCVEKLRVPGQSAERHLVIMCKPR